MTGCDLSKDDNGPGSEGISRNEIPVYQVHCIPEVSLESMCEAQLADQTMASYVAM